MANATKFFDTGFAVLPDDTEMFRSEKAAKREARICATEAEQALFKYNPNAARRNEAPGIPLEDYGTKFIGD